MYLTILLIIAISLFIYYIYKLNTCNENKTELEVNNEVLDKKVLLGNVGEYRVALKLNKLITSNIGKVINNVILQSKNFSTQIDHIIVGNNKKIIIIETKNYKGTIDGNIKDEYWTQTINGNEYDFRNPVMQNNYHKNALSQLFSWYNIKYYKIIHIVVFSDNSCELNVNSDFVVKIGDLESLLYKFLKPCDGNIDDIVELINRKNKSGDKSASKKHNEFIQERIKQKAM